MKLRLRSYWRSSCSHRVRTALGLKGLAYEYVAVNLLAGGQHADDHLAFNPMAQVPTLELLDEPGRWLVQSIPIMEFLDERFPDPPILPRDPYLRARCRALAEIVNSGIQPHQNVGTTNLINEFGGDGRAWATRFISRGLAAFDRAATLTAAAFCVGDHPTIADCCLIPQLFSARRFGIDLSTLPRLLAIEERCLALPAFANAMPDRQPDAVNRESP